MALASRAVSASAVRRRSPVGGAGHNPAMKLRRLREGDVLEDGDVALVRGGDLDTTRNLGAEETDELAD